MCMKQGLNAWRCNDATVSFHDCFSTNFNIVYLKSRCSSDGCLVPYHSEINKIKNSNTATVEV